MADPRWRLFDVISTLHVYVSETSSEVYICLGRSLDTVEITEGVHFQHEALSSVV